MFEGQPKGLFALALANTGERFGYFGNIVVKFTYLFDIIRTKNPKIK